jgi:NAD-dependent deacetylase
MKKKIVFLTGAGVSAESGVKTFRDHDGLWEGFDVMEVASIDGWRKDREKVLSFYNLRRSQMDEVVPNLAHLIIAELEKDFDVDVVTQNVDDLHEKAGSSKILHLHGELSKMCSSKNKELTLPYTSDIKIGDEHPDGSQLRPFIVWFGEDVPMIDEAIKVVKSADILVVLGTSLQVYPAAGLSQYASADCELYYIDPNPADYPALQYFTVIREKATNGMEILKSKLK